MLRIEGDALIDALEDAPAVHPALDASRTASGVFRVPPLETALVDDERWGGGVTLDTATVVVVGAGYEDKRAYYRRLAELGPRLVIVDEPGQWSAPLGNESEQIASVSSPDHRRPRRGCRREPRRPGTRGNTAGRRVDLLGGQRLRGSAGRCRVGTARQPPGGRRCGAQQDPHPGALRPPRPADPEGSARAVAG